MKIKTSLFPNLLLELPWKFREARECIKLIHRPVFFVSLGTFTQREFTEDLANFPLHSRDERDWGCFRPFYIFGSDEILPLGAEFLVSIVSARFGDGICALTSLQKSPCSSI